MLLLWRLRLKCFYNAVFDFLSVFYVLSVYFTTVAQKTFLSVFYNALLELVLVLAVSDTSSVLPQLFPRYPRRAALFGSGFIRSCRAVWLPWVPSGGLPLIGWRFPGWFREGRRRQENIR